jgi:hypothetical protein
MCPPGYTPSPDYGCVAPSAGDYAEGSPAYDYWPDYGWGYPFIWSPGFANRSGGFHHFARFHGGRAFHRGPAFHSAAKSGSFGAGIANIGGMGRR